MANVHRGAPVVLDDVETGVLQLSELGQHVVAPVAMAIRHAILLYVAAEGWQVLRHHVFAQWARTQVDPDLTWLVMDPLLTIQRPGFASSITSSDAYRDCGSVEVR
jgi:hypothetical protein